MSSSGAEQYIQTNSGTIEGGLEKTCNFDFVSNASISSKTGRFFSPSYPQNYPNATRCFYRFSALPHERVVLEFKDILLEGHKFKDCSSGASGDSVTVFEGVSDQSFVLRRFVSRCGERSNEQAVSDGTKLLVAFQSDDNGEQVGIELTGWVPLNKTK